MTVIPGNRNVIPRAPPPAQPEPSGSSLGNPSFSEILKQMNPMSDPLTNPLWSLPNFQSQLNAFVFAQAATAAYLAAGGAQSGLTNQGSPLASLANQGSLASLANQPSPLSSMANQPSPLSGLANQPSPLSSLANPGSSLAGLASQSPFAGLANQASSLAGLASQGSPFAGLANQGSPLAGFGHGSLAGFGSDLLQGIPHAMPSTASKSPEEIVNDVINDLSDNRSSTAATPPAKSCPVRSYPCPHPGCSHETRDTRDHLHHLRQIHGERITIFYCDHCTYASKTFAKVRRHASLIHKVDSHPIISSAPDDPPASDAGTESPIDPFRCPECKYTTTDPTRFKKHQRCHQVYGPTTCNMCDFTTVYAWNLDRHVKSHRTPGRFSCFRCSFSQNTRQSMSFHLQHHHIIQRQDVETMTEPTAQEFTEMTPGAVGHEVFLFERHAVRVNDGYDAMMTEEANSPLDYAYSDTTPTVRKTPNATITVMPVGATEESKSPTKLMSESEIIESPAEPKDLREYESADPDIRKRTCSICGYQGKWISEMVRHKRVHTNERPFKCKYCSRTSKWKADLIRHVAKAHGIKVVSRYSRGAGGPDLTVRGGSKAPEDSLAIDITDRVRTNGYAPEGLFQKYPPNINVNQINQEMDRQKLLTMFSQSLGQMSLPDRPTLNEAQLLEYFRLNGSVSPQVAPTSTSSSDPDHGSTPSPTPHPHHHDQDRVKYSCTACGYQSDLSSEVHKHIRLSTEGHEKAECQKPENAPPEPRKRSASQYCCAKCGFSNNSRAEVTEHLSVAHNGMPAFACAMCSFSSLYRKACIFHAASEHDMAEPKVIENLLEPNQSPEQETAVPPKKRRIEGLDRTPTERAPETLACSKCPFTAVNPTDLNLHIQGHQIPKAPLAYKCAFCPWYSRKKQQIQVHMALHTDTPDSHMPAVERNLITPMSHMGSSSESDQPLDLSKKPDSLSGSPALPMTSSPRPPPLIPHGRTHEGPKNPKENGLLGLADLSDVFREFEALLPNAGLTSPLRQTQLQIQKPAGDNDTTPNLSPWNGNDDEEPEELVPRTQEIQKVEIVVDGKESKVWQCRYCLHTSKRRANVRLHERKHFKRALKGAAFCRCPQCDYSGPREEVLDHMIEEHSDNCHLFGKSGEKIKQKKLPKSLGNGASPYSMASFEGSPIHVAPKPKNHICTQCPAKFTDRAQLMRHSRFHGGDHRYKCHMCNYAVPFPINLTKHYKSHHSSAIIVTGNGTRQYSSTAGDPSAEIEKIVIKEEPEPCPLALSPISDADPVEGDKPSPTDSDPKSVPIPEYPNLISEPLLALDHDHADEDSNEEINVEQFTDDDDNHDLNVTDTIGDAVNVEDAGDVGEDVDGDTDSVDDVTGGLEFVMKGGNSRDSLDGEPALVIDA